MAAELALGLLEGEERVRALRMRLEDPNFAALVRRWEEQAERWLEEVPERPPTDAAWGRIAAALDGEPNASVVKARTAPAQQGWKLATLAASLAAVVFAGLWASEPRSGPFSQTAPPVLGAEPSTQLDVAPNPELRPLSVGDVRVGQIAQGPDKQLVWAVYDRRSKVLLLRLGELNEARRVPELWLLVDGAAPKSLGFLKAGEAMSITLDQEAGTAFEEGAAIAVSLEERSGQPHQEPEGPVLGQTVLSAI
jgi:anti-sigma-K factor RskA